MTTDQAQRAASVSVVTVTGGDAPPVLPAIEQLIERMHRASPRELREACEQCFARSTDLSLLALERAVYRKFAQLIRSWMR